MLPTDIALHILGFFDVWEVARLREVSEEWCNFGNTYLGAVRFVHLKTGIKKRESKQAVVQLVSRHCSSLRSLAVKLHGRSGYESQDIQSMLSATNRLTSLILESRHCDIDSDEDSGYEDAAPCAGFTALRPVVASCAFLSLLSLAITARFTDDDASAMAGRLPHLRALFIGRPYTLCRVFPGSVLSTRGLVNLINGLPSLTILFLRHSAYLSQPLPTFRSRVRRLGLENISITPEVLQSLLADIGAELRALNLSEGWLTDGSVQCIADCCPHLERLCLQDCLLITRACLSSLAQMANLHDVVLDYPDRFSEADLDWLQQHTRSAALNDNRERLSIGRGASIRRVALHVSLRVLHSFRSMVVDDGVPVKVKEWEVSSV